MLLLPWMVAAAIVAWLLLRMDMSEVGAALAKADLVGLLALTIGLAVAGFLADTATLQLLFVRLVTKMSYRETLPIRGAAYFFNAVNYALATGAMGWFLHKKKKIPFARSLSTLMWMAVVDIIALIVLLTGGMAFASELLPPTIRATLPTLLVIAWIGILGGLVYWLARFDFFVLGRLRTWPVFAAFHRARGADYLVVGAARTAFIFTYVLMSFVLLPTFDIHIDLGTLMIYVPILTFVQIVPASVSGLGAVQPVMILLYAPHAIGEDPEAQVFAYSVIIGPLMAVLRLGIGALFIGNVARDMVPSVEDIRQAQAEARAAPQSASASPSSSGEGSGGGGP